MVLPKPAGHHVQVFTSEYVLLHVVILSGSRAGRIVRLVRLVRLLRVVNLAKLFRSEERRGK